jgi:hypothetical protein
VRFTAPRSAAALLATGGYILARDLVDYAVASAHGAF